MIQRLRRHKVIAIEPDAMPTPPVGLTRCEPIPGSILTLELTYTKRPIEKLLERGLHDLGFKSRTWQTGPRSYRTRFEGEWSDEAVDLIRSAVPAIGPVRETAHHHV